MLLADAARDYSAGVLGRSNLEEEFAKLERRALKESPGATLERSADVRYTGQSYELNVPWPVGRGFHRAHARTYGYARPDRETEVVTIRVRAKVVTPKVRLRGEQATKPGRGPAILADYGSTTLIPEGWRYRRDAAGNTILRAR
jgi:N-methylhydantoinase A